MHANRFDTLARSLTTAGSRRLLLGTVCAGLLGAVIPDRTDAKKKPCSPCKKRKHGKCKKKKPDGTVCAGGTCQGGRCLAAAAQPLPPLPCGGCPSGHACLDNGSCASVCTLIEGCPTSCACNTSVEAEFHCTQTKLTCALVPQACITTADCPLGHHCQGTGCGSSRCTPLCQS